MAHRLTTLTPIAIFMYLEHLIMRMYHHGARIFLGALSFHMILNNPKLSYHMKLTNMQIQTWIEEYLVNGYGKKVKARSWEGQYIRGHAPWNNEEDCYHMWLKEVEKNKFDLLCKTSFQELYDDIKTLKFKGIGDLTIYDTATMLGCPNGIYPKSVYLHAGAAVGAKAIGIVGNIVEKSVFTAKYPAFKTLEPIQIEDFLCIYKKQLLGESNEIPIVCGDCC